MYTIQLRTGGGTWDTVLRTVRGVGGLDGKTGLLPDLLVGKQGWKYPVSLLATFCGSKSLKVILIDSDFGYDPLLNPLVTL